MLKQIKTFWPVFCEALRVLIDQRCNAALSHNIPRNLETINPVWLNQVLTSFPEVLSVQIGPRTEGTTSRGILELETTGGPRSVFVKLASQAFAGRVFSNLEALGVRESRFYKGLGSDLPIKAPTLYYTDAHTASGRFVIIIEDLRQPGREFRTLTDGCSVGEAEVIISDLSRLHARFWNDPRFSTELAWLPSYANQPNQNITWMLYRHSVKVCQEKYPELMVGEAMACAHHVIDKFSELYSRFAQGDQTLIHGDAYVANMYFDNNGCDIGYLDFQMVTRGHGVREVTYLVGSCLDPAVTQENIERLLGLYCDSLAQQGIELSREKAWQQHQESSLYLLVGCIVNGALGHMQTEAVNRQCVERATQLVVNCRAMEYLTEHC